MPKKPAERPRYAMRVQWSELDKAYVAESLELETANALAETPEKAAKELGVVMDLMTEVMREQRMPVPPATKVSTYSGQFRLRVPRTMHHQLSLRADFEGVSINTLVVSLLASSLAREEHEKHERAREVRGD